MKVGSLFSGIGGLDLGLERAGMEVIWQVENDEWCTRVLERHWPHVARFRDVRDCHGETVADAKARQRRPHGAPVSGDGEREVPRKAQERGTWRLERGGRPCFLPYVDLICGGFPCQPVSHAGRRMGESDSRWLWPEFYRIICEVRPRWVLAENVPGLLSMDSGRLFGGILRDLSEAGYDAVWFVLSAADVGAPHLRERVFIVAHANDNGSHGATEPQREHEAMGRGEQPGGDGSDGQVADASGSGQRAEQRHLCARESDAPRGGALADADAVRRGRRQDDEGAAPAERDEPETGCVADAAGSRLAQRAEVFPGGQGPYAAIKAPEWWATEPDMGRVAHGVPSRVDRLRGLGNAVVPQVAERIGRWVMMVEAE